MFNLKIKKPDGLRVESSFYNKWEAFTEAIWVYQDTQDDWGIGYLHATRRYITVGNLAAEPFTFVGKGFDITIEDALNPAKEF